ncbi:MAG: ATP synthase F0 subunit B [Deltaproteobacteria bacterium]|nr:ATP synthase F0 subunit B [Deltaproteobacteria bacterium]
MIGFEMARGKSLLIASCTLIISVAFCGLAFASGGGDGGSGGSVANLLYRILNFVLMIIILVVVIRKTPVKEFFSNRKEEIRKKLEDLKRDKETAESRCNELEKKFKEFELQKKEIIQQFKAEGTLEKERIIAEAGERATQILAQADLTIEREIEAAKNRLTQDVVEMAATRAEEIIAGQIQDSDQDHFVNEFIESVEKLH